MPVAGHRDGKQGSARAERQTARQNATDLPDLTHRPIICVLTQVRAPMSRLWEGGVPLRLPAAVTEEEYPVAVTALVPE